MSSATALRCLPTSSSPQEVTEGDPVTAVLSPEGQTVLGGRDDASQG
jgi:hypothetical protein